MSLQGWRWLIGGTYVEFLIFLFIVDCYQVYSTQELFYILNLMVAMKTTHHPHFEDNDENLCYINSGLEGITKAADQKQ